MAILDILKLKKASLEEELKPLKEVEELKNQIAALEKEKQDLISKNEETQKDFIELSKQPQFEGTSIDAKTANDVLRDALKGGNK